MVRLAFPHSRPKGWKWGKALGLRGGLALLPRLGDSQPALNAKAMGSDDRHPPSALLWTRNYGEGAVGVMPAAFMARYWSRFLSIVSSISSALIFLRKSAWVGTIHACVRAASQCTE